MTQGSPAPNPDSNPNAPAQPVSKVALGFALLIGAIGVTWGVATGGFLGWVFACFLLLALRFWMRPAPRDGRLLAISYGSVFAAIVLLFFGSRGGFALVDQHNDKPSSTNDGSS